MKPHSFSYGKLKAAIAMALFASQTSTAWSQESPDTKAKEQEVEVIAVTGTLIEGIDPVGSNVIGFTQEDIKEMGGASANDLLRKVPQMNDFNQLAKPTGDSSIPFEPPQIRGIGGLSGMATLVLLNGHRIVPQGVGLNWIDSSMIPSSLLERVEVIPDGGSSIYGSDAVAGVINFIPKQSMEGGELSANYGVGKDGYQTFDISGAFGTSWDKGSIITALSYANTDAVLGSGLDYRQEDLSSLGGADGRNVQCAPGNVVLNDTTYGLPSLSTGSTNYCSTGDDYSYFPESKRSSLFSFLQHEFSDSISLDVMAFYSDRKATDYDPRDNRVQVDITSANPYFTAVGDETSHTVAFSYEDVFGGLGRANPSEYRSWGITPTLKVQLNESWNVQGSLNFGRSISEYNDYGINATAQAAALASTDSATALNPYDVSQTSSSVLASINDWLYYQRSVQQMLEAKVMASGDLFEMSAGTAKIAFGAEMRAEEYDKLNQEGASGATQDTYNYLDRKSKSLFGELYVPLVGASNAMPGVQTLDLSISARYDNYNDVGSTTNPKIGLTYKPNDDLTVRASWGTSFHAPALADLAAPLQYELFLPISPFRAADSEFFPDFFKPSFLVAGASEGIKPETAETWSLGANWYVSDSTILDLTYWSVMYEDRLDQNAGFFFGPGYYASAVNDDYYLLNPSSAEEVIAKFGDLPTAGFPDLQTMFDVFGTPYVVSDQRKDNMGAYELNGIDFNLRYYTDISLGEVDASLGGTYIVTRDKENVQGSGFEDTLKQGDFNSAISPLNVTAKVGLRHDDVYLTATLLHSSSSEVGDEKIDSFTTLSLYGSYEYSDDTTITLNIDNALDAAPPFRLLEDGVAYQSMGRTMSLGVQTRF